MDNTTQNKLLSVLQKDWSTYKLQKQEADTLRKRLSYNIVSVSSYTGHLENYHSDIWGFLLDAKGIHGKGNHFLALFCDYLVGLHCLTGEEAVSFSKGVVLREKGRIDVCILNAERTACIIIENKINNAVDQDRQLERYYDYACKQHLDVKAMLYVSALGERHSVIDAQQVRAIAACNHRADDLLHGWILPAKKAIFVDGSDDHEDILSFLHQYSLLLQHLSVSNLKTMLSKTLYELLNRKEDLETASLLVEELDSIKLYRHQVFSDAMGHNYFEPFTKKTHYPDYINHMIFREWNYEGRYNFQFDIVHYRNRTRFCFYETKGRMSKEETAQFLTTLLGSPMFLFADTINGTHHFHYTISLDETVDSLEKLDEKAIATAKVFFAAMKHLHKQPVV